MLVDDDVVVTISVRTLSPDSTVRGSSHMNMTVK